MSEASSPDQGPTAGASTAALGRGTVSPELPKSAISEQGLKAGVEAGAQITEPVIQPEKRYLTTEEVLSLQPKERWNIVSGLPKEIQQEAIKAFGLEEAVTNALLPDEERLQVAEQVLEAPLAPKQEQGILQAHAVGVGKLGKDKTEAGVYNYTQAQLLEKARILKEAGFNPEQRRKLMEKGLVGAAPEWFEKALQRKSEFQETMEEYEKYAEISKHPDRIPADQKDAFDIRFKELQESMEALTQGAFDSPVLIYLRGQILNKYIDAVYRPRVAPEVGSSAHARQRAGKTPDEFIVEAKQMWGRNPENKKSNYEETFWEYGEQVLMEKFGMTVDQVNELRQKYEGIASYMASKAAIAIEKDFKGESLNKGKIGQEAGDKFFLEIREVARGEIRKREDDRRKERKTAPRKEKLPYNDWREKFEFTWAETPEELRDCVHEWLDWFREQLPAEAVDKVYESAGLGLKNAIASMERMLPELGIEADSTLAQELRDTIESHVAVIGGVRMLEVSGKDGFEHYIKFLTDFAQKFLPHSDAILLGNTKSAIIQDFLSDGKISLGGEATWGKPVEGQTKTYRQLLEEQARIYAANHELFIRKQDFEVAQGTRYGWHDTIEELLLIDQRDRVKVNQITDPAEKAAAITKIDTRTKIFQNIKDRWDKEDITAEEKAAGITRGLYGLTPEQRQDRIRSRIRVEMDKRGSAVAGKRIDAMEAQFIARYRDYFAKDIARLNLSPTDAQKALDAKMADPKIQLMLKKLLNPAKDKALWKWVEEYNTEKQVHSEEGWFPSYWDEVRLKINRSTKLIDRALSKEEFKSMVEEVEDPFKDFTTDEIEGLTRTKYKMQIRKTVEAKGLSPADTEKEIFELLKNKEEDIQREIDGAKFERQQRDAEAKSAFNINRDYQKFLGVDARWGGLTTRELGDNGETVLKTIYSEIEEILKAKIDLEEKEIEDKVDVWKKGFIATQGRAPSTAEIGAQETLFINSQIEGQVKKHMKTWVHGYMKIHPKATTEELNKDRKAEKETKEKLLAEVYKNNNQAAIKHWIDLWKDGFLAVAKAKGLTDEQIEEKIIKQRRLFRRDSVFAATLGLREIGIANNLAISDYFYYGDPAQIKAFAPLVGYTTEHKEEIAEILDRGRREVEAVVSKMADKHMDKEKYGGLLVVTDDPDLVLEKDEEGHLKTYHEEIDARRREINEGGEFALRNIFESRFMISTSGGVKMAALISRLADLGVNDFLWEMGCLDFREFQGFAKRRDEVEFRMQPFINLRKQGDPVSWVKRLRGANNALPYLTGGEVQGQGYVPGVLNEPFNGLWRFRDEFLEFTEWISVNLQYITEGKGEVPKFNSKEELKTFLNSEKVNKQINPNTPEKVKQFRSWVLEMLSYEEVGDYLKTVHKDKMVPVGGEILKFLLDYMSNRRYVTNRAGYATKNWQYDNLLMLRDFFGITNINETEPIIAKKGDLNEGETKKTGKPVYYDGGEVIAGTGGEMVGADHLAYAPEGRTIVATDIFTAILRGSSYHTLDAAATRALDGRAHRVKEAMEQKKKDIEVEIKNDKYEWPPGFVAKLDARAAILRSQHVTDETITEDRNNWIKDYVELRLSKEFIGESYARLVAA